MCFIGYSAVDNWAAPVPAPVAALVIIGAPVAGLAAFFIQRRTALGQRVAAWASFGGWFPVPLLIAPAAWALGLLALLVPTPAF